MKIIVAPDSFKGSLTSAEACKAIKAGWLQRDPHAEVVEVPITDGGEGTVDALTSIMGGELAEEEVLDPLGRPITAAYGWIDEDKTAIVETAAASGLPLVSDRELNPGHASTYGTGQLIAAALDRGAERIILGLGGSATVDAGLGCFEALGLQGLDKEGRVLKLNGAALGDVAEVNTEALHPRVNEVDWLIASDVTSPLLGNKGAISVFGPQKGVRDEELPFFERRMSEFAQVMEQKGVRKAKDLPGSGAAGGFGFTLFSLIEHITMESGFDLIARLGKLEEQIASADIVLTGEGKIDEQTLYGKGPAGVARIAQRYGKPCIGFAGKVELRDASGHGFKKLIQIADDSMSVKESMDRGFDLLEKAVRQF